MAAKCLKAAAAAAVDGCRDELQELSGEIWKNPELGFEEVKAHELLTDFLEKKGFAVERSYTGIKTAFRATFGSGRPNVCVICEYDALRSRDRPRVRAQSDRRGGRCYWPWSESCPRIEGCSTSQSHRPWNSS